MIKITETEEVVILHCTKCGEVKCVEVDSPRFAYREINKFRKIHLECKGKAQSMEVIMDSQHEEWDSKFDALATYNSEVMRGLVHTREYEKRMDELQKEYYEVLEVIRNSK